VTGDEERRRGERDVITAAGVLQRLQIAITRQATTAVAVLPPSGGARNFGQWVHLRT